MSELPSEVVDMKYLRFPPVEKVVDSDEEWSRCGKWILNNISCDQSWTNGAWVALQDLVGEGSLLMIKVTTAAFTVSNQHILCYTKPGKETIRLAAEAIRKVVYYDSMMHYKVNHLTENQINRLYGYKDVSVYMHSYLGRFYSRDELNLWKLEEDIDNQNEVDVDVDVPFELDSSDSEISDNELPSMSRSLFLCEPSFLSQHNNKNAGQFIQIICSLKQENDGRLPEADRLWMAGRRLLIKGEIRGIVCRKSPQTAEFNFYVDNFLRMQSLAGICNTVFKTANFKGFMYFRTFQEGWTNKIKYKFSSEGELYGNHKFVPKYVD